MRPTLSSVVASAVVVMTTAAATSDGKVGIITTLSFPWLDMRMYYVISLLRDIIKSVDIGQIKLTTNWMSNEGDILS